MRKLLAVMFALAVVSLFCPSPHSLSPILRCCCVFPPSARRRSSSTTPAISGSSAATVATRAASPPASASKDSPHFSPDGSMIAFTGEYDGNRDVYVIPATGGVPRRLTYHPADEYVAGWTPDGKKILFNSWGNSFMHFEDQLYTVPVEGGFPTQLPLPIARRRQLLARRHAPRLRSASQVAGGLEALPRRPDHADLDSDLKDSSVVKIPRDNSNDDHPMWVGDTIYFLSDRNGPVSLFAYDTKTKQVSEALHSDGLDFKDASAGPDAIVIEQFGAIKLYDLQHASGEEHFDPRHRRYRRRAPALRQGRSQAHSELQHFADRRARRLRSLGRDFHRPHRQGRHSQHHAQSRRRRSRSGMVARRQVHRLFFRRVRRIRSGHPRPERPRHGAPHQSRQSAVVLLHADVVARQQEDCLHRQAPAVVVSSISTTPRPSSSTPTTSAASAPRNSTRPGRPTTSGSPTPSSLPAASTRSSSTRSSRARPSRSPTA